MWAWSAACWGAPSIFAVVVLKLTLELEVVLGEKKLVAAGVAAGVGVEMPKRPMDGAGIAAGV